VHRGTALNFLGTGIQYLQSVKCGITAWSEEIDSKVPGVLIKAEIWVRNSSMDNPTATSEAEIWSRAIRPEVGDLPATAAREMLRLQVANEDTARVRELSAKANTGNLTAVETEELDHYLNVGRALEFLKAKARLSLRGDAAAA